MARAARRRHVQLVVGVGCSPPCSSSEERFLTHEANHLDLHLLLFKQAGEPSQADHFAHPLMGQHRQCLGEEICAVVRRLHAL
ncbi:MAG: hypothetical protein BJ554DRAFT_8313 [Olpidium bornovanus]|uniref:Uncharacterized protein n=1 Tax=Olpidium bornovanus TaxID=278681 RepID=A0A8H7ZU76_9FUNG|nr:MAG: hypothetical protein BJ554DRAFT_8313 [Olpidium bornovanus]